jgi:hypothetical protein
MYSRENRKTRGLSDFYDTPESELKKTTDEYQQAFDALKAKKWIRLIQGSINLIF